MSNHLKRTPGAIAGSTTSSGAHGDGEPGANMLQNANSRYAQRDPQQVHGVDGLTRLREAKARIIWLEDELERAHAHLQTSELDHGVARETMTRANEEMQSINEELRTLAEVLESSKDELQSVNEQLLALNEELEGKVGELNRANSDLQNLMNATEVGAIFLDRELLIKRVTPQIEFLLDISTAAVGEPLSVFACRLGNEALADDAANVLEQLSIVEREVQCGPNASWYLARLRPYRSVQGFVEGVVITLVDITDKKKHEEQLERLVVTLEELLTARAVQIKELTSELILSEQSERQRVAQILHDDLQQLLYAFQIRVGTLTDELSSEQAGRLAQANTLIVRALDVTRTLTVELSPPVLKGDDVTDTLDWLALRMEEMHSLKVNVDSPGPVHLPADLRTLVYHLVRELLFNVVKHAGVDRAHVKVVCDEKQLVLLVEDAGIGFNTNSDTDSQSNASEGFGMRSVRQRLEYVGGRLERESAPGRGSRVRLFVPLTPQSDVDLRTMPLP